MCFTLACSSAAVLAGPFTIQLNAGTNLQNNPNALAAFERAAQDWESKITSPVTVIINADIQALTVNGAPDLNTIGGTGYSSYMPDGSDINLNYTTVRTAMAARAVRPGDAILAALPTTANVSANVPNGKSFDNTTLAVLRANQRALGLLSNSDTRADASIVFNSNFNFDYDRSNGVGSNQIDFQTAATHEIGHALGFLSDVDDFDGPSPPASDNLTTLDLFRFPTSHKPATITDFATYARELAPGVASVTSDTATEHSMSTGYFNGDGNQASHWQDDYLYNPSTNTVTVGPYIGIMDPTLSFGTSEEITDADLRAFELIGYDTVSEPAVVSLLLMCGALGLCHRRRAIR